MTGLEDFYVVLRQNVTGASIPAFGNHHTRSDTFIEDFQHSLRHGNDGLSGSNDEYSLIICQVDRIITNFEVTLIEGDRISYTLSSICTVDCGRQNSADIIPPGRITKAACCEFLKRYDHLASSFTHFRPAGSIRVNHTADCSPSWILERLLILQLDMGLIGH